VLGPVQLTSLGVGAIIGAGIFVATGEAARDVAGPALMVSYVVAGVTCIFAALCYAEFASMVPVAGSAYTYAYATMGELFAWIIGWDLVLEYAVGAATVANGWSGYFQSVLAKFGVQLPAALAGPPIVYDAAAGHFVSTAGVGNLPAILIVSLVTYVLVKGISESASFNAAMVFLKVTVVIFVILVGAFYVNPANWHPFAPYGMSGLTFFGHTILGETAPGGKPVGMLAGAAIIFFAYIGFDAVSTAAEETKDAARDMPFGIVMSLLITTVLYIAISIVMTGMVKYNNLSVDAGVSDAFKQAGLPWAEFIIAAAGVAGITSVLLVLMLSAPRCFWPGPRRDGAPGLLWRRPPEISHAVEVDHHRCLRRNPDRFLPIGALLNMTNIGTLFAFVIVCAAVLIMRRTNPNAERPSRAVLSVVPLLGIVMCLVLMFSLPVENWYRLIVWMALGLVLYFSYGYQHSELRKNSEVLAAAAGGRRR
jgi:APA family basic amino acid/polyamine antiporter